VGGLTPPLLADGARAPVDQGVATFLFLAAVFFGLVGVQRVRGRSFRRLPPQAGWVAVGLAVFALVLAIVLPPIIRPDATTARPSSSARLRFLSPLQGEVFRGSPASVPVRLRLEVGRIVPFTSTRLAPNQGHVHLFLDGALVSMSLTLARTLDVEPGRHVLLAEFVAADHGPFDPRVRTSVTFQVLEG
jgi:hypothetical protein